MSVTYHPFELWSYSLLLVAAVFYFFYLTGKFILSFIETRSLLQKPYSQTFLSTALGWIFVVSCYAIFKSSMQTILLVLLIPFVILLLSAKKQQQSIYDCFKWNSGCWFFSIVVFVTIQFLQLVNCSNSEFSFFIQNWDYSYYSNFIEAIQRTGIENTHGPAVFYEQNAHGTTPYHYTELWTAAFFSDLSGWQPIVSLRLCVYSFFEVLFFLGILSIWEIYKIVRLQETIISFCLMFVGGMFFEFYEYIPFMGTVKYLSNNHLMGYGNVKYGPLYVSIVSVFLLYKSQLKKAAFAVWILIPVFFISTLPAIAGGCVLVACYLLWVERKGILFFYWALPLTVYAAMGVFYLLTSAKDNSSVSSPSELLLVFVSGQSLQSAIALLSQKLAVCFILFPTKYLLSVLPWLIWIGWQMGVRELKQITNAYKPEVLVILFSLLSGLFAFWLWYINVDAQQLFNNLAYPTINVLIIVLIARLWVNKEISKLGMITLCLLVGYMMFFNARLIQKETIQYNSKYSSKYLIEVKKLAQRIPESGGVFLAGQNYYDSLSVFTYKPTQHIEGYYLPLMNVHTPFILSIFDMPKLKKAEEKVNQQRFLHSSYFYRYCESKQVELQDDSIEKTMLTFIKKNHFRYLVVGKGAKVPFGIEEACETCVLDERSGERFCVFKAE